MFHNIENLLAWQRRELKILYHIDIELTEREAYVVSTGGITAAKVAEGEAAKAVVAAVADVAKVAIETTKEQEESDEETSAIEVWTEDVNTELYKIDVVCCPPPFCDGGSVELAVLRSATPITVTASSRPGTTPAPATPTTTPRRGQRAREHSKWVLVLRRMFGYENELRKTKLDVTSPLIKDAIKEGCPPERAVMESEKAPTL